MRNLAILAFAKTALTLISLMLIMLSSCQTDGVPNKQVRNIEDYIDDNNLTLTTKTDEGLYYIKLSDGDGTSLSFGEDITVNYKGNLLNGDVFDSGTFTFTLGAGRVVPGFDIGIARMTLGEKAIIIFPSKLGYGSRGQGSIPKNSPLVFEVEVIEVN